MMFRACLQIPQCRNASRLGVTSRFPGKLISDGFAWRTWKTGSKLLVPSAFFLLGLACSSGRDPEALAGKARKLIYTNPVAGTYQLVQNTSLSAPGHLVLDVVGPSGTQGRGMAFQVQADSLKVSWAKVGVQDPEFAQNAGVWNMGTGSLPIVTRVVNGQLDVGVGQKGLQLPSQDMGGALVRISLKMVEGAPSGEVSLTVKSANLWPDTGLVQSVPLACGQLKIE